MDLRCFPTIYCRAGVSTFSRRRATFTLAYRLAGRNVINQENSLKLRSNLLKMLLTYYCKQVQVLLNNFPLQNQLPVTYLSLLWLEWSFNFGFKLSVVSLFCFLPPPSPDSHASLPLFVSNTLRPRLTFFALLCSCSQWKALPNTGIPRYTRSHFTRFRYNAISKK
jgi:hypothetical protein